MSILLVKCNTKVEYKRIRMGHLGLATGRSLVTYDGDFLSVWAGKPVAVGRRWVQEGQVQ